MIMFCFSGMSAEPETAQLFAESFCEFHKKLFHTYRMLEAYHYPVVKKPANVEGYLHLATEEYSTTIAEFMAGFSENAFGKCFMRMPKTRIPTKYINRLVLWRRAELPISNLTCAPNVDYAIKK